MSLHSKQTQISIFNILNNDSTLDGLVGNNRIYDEVPQGSSYPYIELGDETTIDAGLKDKDGQEFTQTIHIWSRYRGSKQVKEIAEMLELTNTLNNLPLPKGTPPEKFLRIELETLSLFGKYRFLLYIPPF